MVGWLGMVGWFMIFFRILIGLSIKILTIQWNHGFRLSLDDKRRPT